MADIFLVGHGGWLTRGSGQIYTSVPKGTSVVFYTPVGRFLGGTQTAAILTGGGGALPGYEEIKEFKTCPNLTLGDGLFPMEAAALLSSGVRYVRVQNLTSLSDLLIKYAGNRLHWMACQPRLGGQD